MTVADDLIAASYEGVLFPVSDFSVEAGNDLAEHTSYRRPGADIEFTGVKAQRGSFTVVLADIPELVRRYGAPLTLRQRLNDAFATTPGELAHPLIGNLTAAVGDVSWRMSSDKRSMIEGSVSWIEQNASGQAVLELRDDPSAVAPVTSATNADTAASSARIAGYTPLAPTVQGQLDTLSATPSFGQVSSVFSTINRAINANLALPAMATSAAAPVVGAITTLRAALARARNALLPNLVNAPSYTVPPGGLPLWQIAVATLGSVDAAQRLLDSNPITTPRLVPAGTVIRLPSSA